MIRIDFKITNRKPTHAGVIIDRFEDANIILKSVKVEDSIDGAHTYSPKEAKEDVRTFLAHKGTTDDDNTRMDSTIRRDLMDSRLGNMTFGEAELTLWELKDKLRELLACWLDKTAELKVRNNVVVHVQNCLPAWLR